MNKRKLLHHSGTIGSSSPAGNFAVFIFGNFFQPLDISLTSLTTQASLSLLGLKKLVLRVLYHERVRCACIIFCIQSNHI